MDRKSWRLCLSPLLSQPWGSISADLCDRLCDRSRLITKVASLPGQVPVSLQLFTTSGPSLLPVPPAPPWEDRVDHSLSASFILLL